MLFVSLLATMLLTTADSVNAQQPKKITRVCQLGNNAANQSDIYIKTFPERLAELGYVEGQNVITEQRFYQEKPERLPCCETQPRRMRLLNAKRSKRRLVL
jgi:hypothetical protein